MVLNNLNFLMLNVDHLEYEQLNNRTPISTFNS